MHRILIADDERVIRRGIETLLKGEGYEVVSAVDGKDALAKFAEKRPRLVLLDVMMPGLNGFAVCERIRRSDPTLPVLFLTAREGEADEIRGLGLGADDYILKSAPESVLLARIARALERSAEDGPPVSGILDIGGVQVDLDVLEVRDGRELRSLTRTEGDILRVLDSERGRYFGVEELISALRGRGFACEDNMLYTHMHRLRAKLGSGGAKLVNNRFVGYRLLP